MNTKNISPTKYVYNAKNLKIKPFPGLKQKKKSSYYTVNYVDMKFVKKSRLFSEGQ